jgi:diguanylate cyclase (GGDEF)-like protein
MLDIDDFRRLNTSAGHSAGDAVLKSLGQLLLRNVRREDVACRYGGDEFVLILPEMAAPIAQRRAEALREQLRQLRVEARGKPIGPLTASIGVASYPSQGDTPQTLLSAAEQALQRAQDLGRDRVLVAR